MNNINTTVNTNTKDIIRNMKNRNVGKHNIRLYKYDKIPERITKIICNWYELGIPLNDMIRRINPKLREYKLKQFDIGDICFYILYLSKNNRLNEVKRLGKEGEVALEYDITQIKKYISAWTEGKSRAECHAVTKSKVFDSVKFGNRLYASLNKKVKVNVEKGVEKKIDTEIKQENKQEKIPTYKLEDIRELEHENEKLKDFRDNIFKILAEVFSLFRLARMNDKYVNSYVIFFKDLPLRVRTELINLLPFTYNTFSYPERIGLKEFADGWHDKNSKNTRGGEMTLSQAEMLYDSERGEEDKKIAAEVFQNAYPRLAAAKKLIRLETTNETEKRMSVVEGVMPEMTEVEEEIDSLIAMSEETKEAYRKEIEKFEKKLQQAKDITLKSIELIKYRNKEEELLSKKALKDLQLAFAKQKEIDETSPLTDPVELSEEVIKNTNDNTINDNTINDNTINDLDELTELVEKVELEEELRKPIQRKQKLRKKLNKINVNDKNVNDKNSNNFQKEKEKRIQEERRIPLSEKLKLKMKHRKK